MLGGWGLPQPLGVQLLVVQKPAGLTRHGSNPLPPPIEPLFANGGRCGEVGPGGRQKTGEASQPAAPGLEQKKVAQSENGGQPGVHSSEAFRSSVLWGPNGRGLGGGVLIALAVLHPRVAVGVFDDLEWAHRPRSPGPGGRGGQNTAPTRSHI